jgi:hypothetical protein
MAHRRSLWEAFEADYDLIRDRISRVVPDFENFNERCPQTWRIPAAQPSQ